MPSSARQRVRALLAFCVGNFGPLIVFYFVNRWFGTKPAIVASLAFAAGEIGIKLRRGEATSTLFKFSTAMTLVFGAVDLYCRQPTMLRYEACVSNVFTGLFFLGSLYADKTILQEYREKQDPTRPATRDRVAYFRFLTMVWALYFFAKAWVYFWISGRFSLGESMALRAVIGTASFYALLFASVFGSRYLFPWMKRHGLLPEAEPAGGGATA